MNGFTPESRKRAEAYLAGERQIVGELGWGTDGCVYSLKPYSVLKVFVSERLFLNELRVYQRLADHGVSKVGGCAVPQFRGQDSSLWVLEMSYVSPPCVIDFGKARLDDPGDFPPEVWQHWREEKYENFGARAAWAFRVYHELIDKFGVYHDDINHGNYMLDTGQDAKDD